MASDAGCKVEDLLTNEAARKKIDLTKYVDAQVGLPTLKDIIAELAKPGRDPRKQFELFSFVEGIDKPTDLQIGMKLPGIVTVVEVDLKRNRIALSMKSKVDLDNRRSTGEDRESRPNSGENRNSSPRPPANFNPGAAQNNDWFSQALNQAKKK
jgi:protein Tex